MERVKASGCVIVKYKSTVTSLEYSLFEAGIYDWVNDLVVSHRDDIIFARLPRDGIYRGWRWVIRYFFFGYCNGAITSID